MEFLKLFERTAADFSSGALAVLPDAKDVKVTRQINEDFRLEFLYPVTAESAAMIKEQRIVVCKGQGFRINRITDSSMNGNVIRSVEARHVFYDLERVHVPTIPDDMGAAPLTVLKKAFSYADGFTILETAPQGLELIDEGGFLIDWWTKDKTNPAEVMKAVIECAGFGEIYIDNFRAALVKQLGTDNGARLTVGADSDGFTVERDCTDIITRLYPYGENDLTVSSVNGGRAYIDSGNIEKYGICGSFMDFSEVSQPEELYNYGAWQFDERNPERIDVPAVTVEGKLVNLAKCGSFSEYTPPEAGDAVTVTDAMTGFDMKLRVTKTEYYPFEPLEDSVTLGRVKKDLFLYMKEFNRLTKRYKRASNSNGDVASWKIDGVLCTAKNIVASDFKDANMEISDELIRIKSGGVVRALLGNSEGSFRFVLSNAKGADTVSLDSDGNAVFSGVIKTGEDAEIGKFLKIRTVESDGYAGGIQFINSSGQATAAIFLMEGNDGSENLFAGVDDIILKAGSVSIYDLAQRVAALEKGAAS